MRTLKFFGALALLGIVGCTTNGSAPTSFGVNLTIDGTGLTPATLKSITSLVVTVTGEKSPYSKTLAGSTIKGGTVHVEYIPGITSGSLVFEVNADNGSETVASGVTSSIAVVAGKATSATVKLASGEQVDMGVIPNGTPCAHDSDCTSATESGHCADGVCCDSACTGVCESCNLTGTVGTCAAIAANTDPDGECGAVIPTPVPPPPPPPDMAGADLLGVTPPDLLDVDMATYNLPDGGVQITNTSCAGSCTGDRSCSYPGASKTCGTPFCNAASQIETPVCNGTGSCTIFTPSNCSDFVCGGGACKTSCSANSDCLATDYCNVNTNQCVTKLPVGIACPQGPATCASGYCVGTTQSDGTPSGTQYCCNSACGYPNTCNKTGQEGQCECPGVTCAMGVGCNVFYLDHDKDGWGDKTMAMAGCGETPPSGYVTPQAINGQPTFDCNDDDPNAFPGQTAFFTYPTVGTSSYDYNCDGSETMQKPPYSQVCYLPACNSSTCTAVDERAYLNHTCSCFIKEPPPLDHPRPDLVCACAFCSGSVTYGLTALGTYCGTKLGNGNATYTECGYCQAASGSPTALTNYAGAQPCH